MPYVLVSCRNSGAGYHLFLVFISIGFENPGYGSVNGSNFGYENPEYGSVGPNSVPNPDYENPVYESVDGMLNPGNNQCNSAFCKACSCNL